MFLKINKNRKKLFHRFNIEFVFQVEDIQCSKLKINAN
jgi:hypothetical protein